MGTPSSQWANGEGVLKLKVDNQWSLTVLDTTQDIKQH